MKKALITGVTGQDGSYLSELLLSKGYQVIGLCRRSSTNTHGRLENLYAYHDKGLFTVEEFEVSDASCVYSTIEKHKPDEVYNLAAQSHVGTSFSQSEYTFQVNAVGVVHLLEAIRKFSAETRFYQASTSELFGNNVTVLDNGQEYQTEKTVFDPQSPYAVAKLAAHNMVNIYRKAYNIHASCGILFNHESERRGEQFVTKKIVKWVAGFKAWASTQKASKVTLSKDFIHCGSRKYPKLRLGNLSVCRDWGHAQDYVYAMWLMLQQDLPGDYVIATGETHSVKEFLFKAFKWIGISESSYNDLFVIDSALYRPADVVFLRGLPDKAKLHLGWAHKIPFDALVNRMLEFEEGTE